MKLSRRSSVPRAMFIARSAPGADCGLIRRLQRCVRDTAGVTSAWPWARRPRPPPRRARLLREESSRSSYALLFDEDLAQAAYLIGCPASGEAIVIDPERDIDRYIDAAKREKLRIIAVAETHIHADFLSGTRELAERLGGPRCTFPARAGPAGSISGSTSGPEAGPIPTSSSATATRSRSAALRSRPCTPPATRPEHVAFLITDRGSAPSRNPMGLVSGDFCLCRRPGAAGPA